jgi:acyl-CoA synthetase (AMP-forming)/AMP-acid ligase II
MTFWKLVSDVLLRHSHIADVAVIGLPDARTGERVHPEQLEIADALPRNSMGKVLAQQLRDRFAAASVGGQK